MDEVAVVDAWLRSLLWRTEVPGLQNTAEFEIHRLKGRLLLENGEQKIIQGVREIYEIIDSPECDTTLLGKVVMIGRHIGGIDFAASLQSTLGSSKSAT